MTRLVSRQLACFVAVFLVLASPCVASRTVASPTKEESAKVIAGCIRQASNGQPWLEKTLWGLRDQEGGWLGAEIRNRDGSHDLGPLQVNSWWVPKLADLTGRPQAHVRWWLTHDACFNVLVARWIFLSGLSITRDYWRAVGVYHSPTAWRQRRYAAAVASRLKQRFGATIFDYSDRRR